MVRLAGVVGLTGLLLLTCTSADGEAYSLGFSRRADRLTWRPTFPSWSFATPVTLSASRDSTAMLRLNASATMSAILDQRDDRNNWTESATINTSLLYPILGPRASVGITANMSSRNATLLQQKTRSQTISFRFQYSPLANRDGRFESLRFSVVPGAITARRASPVNPDSVIEETGLQYTGSLSTSPDFSLAGRKLSTSVSLNKADNTLQNNKSRSESLRLSAGYSLPGDVRTNASFSEQRSQTGVTRSAIDSADTAVVAELSERRNTSVNTSMTFKALGYNVSGSQSWSKGLNTNTANADADPRNRYFARDRENEGWNVSASLDGRLVGGLTGRAHVTWAATDDRRLPVALATGAVYRDPTDDRQDRDLTTGGSLDWQLDGGRQIVLSGSARMNRVDNPGAPEQDRDSYNEVTSLSYRGARASGLRYDLTLTSTTAHRINLAAVRAAESQRNQELRLSANTSYERLATSISHNFEISARRTIFDFDRQVYTLIDRRSNIRRGWSMRHRLQRPLSETLQLNATYSFSADDFGTLIVEDERQIVEQDNTDHSVSAGVNYRPSEALSFGASYSFRLDRQWALSYGRSESSRELAFRNAHRNLAANLDYRPSGYTGFSARASRSRQRSGTFDDLSITLSRTF